MKHRRCRLAAAWCSGFVSLACFGQSAPSFTPVTSVSGPSPIHVYAVDVNNDGLTDIVQSGIIPNATTAFFTVSINRGNGIFSPPVNYTVKAGTWPALTWGDFNNDGKVDIAFALPGTNQAAIYQGNGDGTFQAPVTTTFALPAGYNFATSSVVAADFNHDGNIDLVAAGYVVPATIRPRGRGFDSAAPSRRPPAPSHSTRLPTRSASRAKWNSGWTARSSGKTTGSGDRTVISR